MSYENDAYRYAIRNAFDHKGKADAGALIGKLKALYPNVNVKELVPFARVAAEKVNNMGMDEIHAEFDKFNAEGFELKIPDKKVGLQDLDWAANEPVITRFAPNPSAPSHMGHLRPAILSYLYAKKYNGKFILRFEDTDPKIKKPLEGMEKLYLEDLAWVGITPDQIVYQSDRLEIYTDYMKQIIGLGKAYVCTCDDEEWKKMKIKKKECPCRTLSVEENVERLKKMFAHTYKQGKAVLRIKTDMHAEDPAERDWAAARIVDKPMHYKVKNVYVWPTYNFSTAIDDHLMGVTLIIRGQQHASNVKKQKWIYTHFGWNFPHSFHHGKLSAPNVELSKSKMVEGIQSGKYAGWDDPKLFTVSSLRRKGFHPHAFIDMMIDLGVKPSDTELTLELMGNYNKPYVQNAPTIALLVNPIPLEVDFGPEMDVNLDGKIVHLNAGRQPFFISKEDAQRWKNGNTFRLRNAYIAKINSMDEYHVNAQFVSTRKLENTTQTNWLTEGVDAEITLPSGEKVYALAGDVLRAMNVNDEVFFPHFGYCRVDEKNEKEIKLWFTHP